MTVPAPRRTSSVRALGGLVAVLVLVAAASAMWSASPIELSVMTFNIRTALGRDGNNSWPHRKELVVDTIAQLSPQVVGLQEALSAQVEYIEESLPDYRWLGIDRGLNGGEGLSEYTPIFYRHLELVPIESGNFWLSATPDTPPDAVGGRGRRRGVGRIVTWARFHHLASGRQLYAYNTHLTLRRGSRQIDSARLISDRIASLPSGSAVVVTGDFNAPGGESETWRVATAQGLEDAWLIADERRGPAFTLSMFGPPVDWGVGRLDWVLVGGPVRVRSVETIAHNDQGRYPSDHYPVVARLEFDP